MGWTKRGLTLLVVVAAIDLGSATARAQAVVDGPGTLSATLQHEFGFANKIVESKGAEYPSTYVNSQTTTLSVEYVPIARLGLELAVPFVGTKYNKEKSGMLYDPHGPYDDGKYHFTAQDLKFDARYQVLEDPLALAIEAGAVIPMADYPVQGSAAPGRHLKQGRFGFAVSFVPPPLPRAFLNVEYHFTLSEKADQSADTKKFSQSRSDGVIQAGYFATDKLGLFVLGAWRLQHDGVNFIEYDMLTADQKTFHDPILKEAGLSLGGGALYQLTERLYASASYAHFVGGRNTLNMNVLGVQLGWTIL